MSTVNRLGTVSSAVAALVFGASMFARADISTGEANRLREASTVIKDKFVDATALCQAVGASACSAAGITP